MLNNQNSIKNTREKYPAVVLCQEKVQLKMRKLSVFNS
jgi:hypothetical protein